MVTKSDIDREYHVFLFEKIILCCKEALQLPPTARGSKSNKNNSILKKQVPPTPTGLGSLATRDNPLLLKGRIFLGNVTQAIPVASRTSTGEDMCVVLHLNERSLREPSIRYPILLPTAGVVEGR